jgi:hypothetical protein
MFYALFWFFPEEKPHESVACTVLWCEGTAPDGNKKLSPPNWHDSKAKSGSGTPPQPSATQTPLTQ